MQSKMLFHNILLLFGISVFYMSKFVAARFCEGGHICSLPRECCTQGCCPPYPSGPRQLPPPSDHVLNLFFISHWFFWCVVVAIILAILCAYSLWKKRRTLCGWGFSEHHRAQSEGDSAGSCYAPPQYSRCNSFHHPPPPYTEVTSKPDLYPLVFTCNSDNGKNGSSYLMVQYFRNYIVRPVGSLSAASTVDSLSSSFICNANEANTLVPPPYSRAASPDIGFNTHFQQQCNMMPRSASQLVCHNSGAGGGVSIAGGLAAGGGGQQDLNSNAQQMYQQQLHQPRTSLYTVVTVNASAVGNSANGSPYNTTHLCTSESGNFYNDDSPENSRSGSVSDNNSGSRDQRIAGFMQSQSDQHFRYIANSNSSISDIFVNNNNNNNNNNNSSSNNCTTGSVGGGNSGSIGGGSARADEDNLSTSISIAPAPTGGTPVIFSNGCITPIPLHRAHTNPTQFVETHREQVYNSCNSIEGISITVPVATPERTDNEFRDLHILRRSLETCCQLLQHQQQSQHPQTQKNSSTTFTNDRDSNSPLRMHELSKKYAEEALRSYVTSGTCSGVSSLANIGTPSSPPQATSPTGEVKEILDQIRQLQEGVSYEDLMLNTRTKPTLHHTMSSPSPTHVKLQKASEQRFTKSMSEHQNSIGNALSPTSEYSMRLSTTTPSNLKRTTSVTSTGKINSISTSSITSKRPSSLQQTKKKFYSPKPNKAMYIPMMSTGASRSILKSPVNSVVGANFFGNRGRVRKVWISRSAPTTPGTALPPNRLGDDSPLLREHDEDQEGEQNAEMD